MAEQEREYSGDRAAGAAGCRCGGKRESDAAIRKVCAAGKEVVLFLPDSADGSVVWLPAGQQEEHEIWRLLSEPRPVLAAVYGTDWNRELSPWYAESVFDGGEAFAGGADEYLKVLADEIIPAAEREMGFTPMLRCIAGYSMAGLFALYACCRTKLFDRIACMSGSLWFDGFTDFLRANGMARVPESAFFSLGSREKKTGNTRMASIERCTEEVCGILRGFGADVSFELTPGGHFTDIPRRIARGVGAICG